MKKKISLLLASLFLTIGTAWAQTAATYADGLYKIYWQADQRGYLTYHADYSERPQLAGVVNHNPNGHYQLTDAGVNLGWYLYTSQTSGKSYLFEATTGKFITIKPGEAVGNGKACVLSTEVSTESQLTLMAADGDVAGTGYLFRYVIGNTNYHFCSGCGDNKGSNPVRFSTDGQGDGGNRFVFADAEGLTISDDVKNAAIAKINAFENSAFNVTYKYVYGTTVWKTQEDVEVRPGQAFPVATAAPYGVTYTFPNDNVVPEDLTEGAEVIVTCTSTIAYATDYNSIKHWYYMNIDANSHYLYHVEGVDHIALNKTAVDVENKKAYAWAFVGNPFDGFKIVNNAAGENMILSSSTTMSGTTGSGTYPIMTSTPVLNGNNELWVATASGDRTNGFYLNQKGYPNNRMNNRDDKLAYWTGGADAGSTFVISEIGGVFDLGDLKNTNAYALQAERAPLLYIDENGKTDKLASTYNTNIETAPSNANQQFLILRTENTPAGSYYLYSVGAQKFVGADLVFTDYPSPVLSFEAYSNAAHNTNYPWWVKIGDKYAITGNGTAGHNLHHVTDGDDDEGKRYRILDAGAYDTKAALDKIKFTENTVASAAGFSNDKVYTVTPADNASTGVWDVKYDGETATMLAITKFTGKAVDPASENQQFAFLTANGEYYLYSYGAKKFVAKDGDGQKLTDELSDKCLVEFLNSTIAANQKFYPLVVKVGGSQLHSSYQSHLAGRGGIITNWNNTESNGNALAIVAVDGTVDLSDAVAKIATYQMQREKTALNALIGEAQTLVGKDYIGATGKETLNTAIAAAQGVVDDANANVDGVKAQITSLTATINSVAYVVDPAEFSNNAIYTFLSNRNATAYMMYDGTNDFVASKFMQKDLEAGDDKVNCHWAVYKSEIGKYYMYNLGAQKFMGTETAANANIPFSATPQTTELKFKTSVVAGHPIMISSNGGAGAVNHSKDAFEGKNITGVVNWAGGFGETDDPGNAHKVAIVGELTEATLTTIKTAVEAYEAKEKADATAKFEAAIGELEFCVAWVEYDYYTTTAENLAAAQAMSEWKTTNLAGATIDDIKAKTQETKEIIAKFSVIPPASGFYRITYDFGTEEEPNVKYVQAEASNVANKENALVMTEKMGAASIFYYTDGKLLSYSAGLYLDESTNRGLQTVGTNIATVEFGAVYPGAYKLKIGNYLHANKSGDVYFVDHCSEDLDHEAHKFMFEKVTSLPVTIGATGYSTFYTPVAMEIPEDVTASIVTGLDGNKVVLEKVEGVVPAHTGLILEGEAKDYEFAIATTAATANYEDNLLDGTTARTLITAEDDYKYYVLGNKNSKVALYLAELNQNEGKAFINNANKAYLPVGVSQGGQEAPAMFSFGRGGEGTTSVEMTTDNSQQLTVIYDFTGRCIEKVVEKGIYIVNGQKVVIK